MARIGGQSTSISSSVCSAADRHGFCWCSTTQFIAAFASSRPIAAPTLRPTSLAPGAAPRSSTPAGMVVVTS